MAIKILAYLVVLWSLLISDCIEGIPLSKKERLDYEKQFKLHKKSSVKTIKTEYGDVYDCVDFYKQPAFDHPSLKNHTFHHQMRPSYIPEQRITTTSSQEKQMLINSLKLKDGGCPIGTVPIRRVSKRDFIQMKRFNEEYASRFKPNSIQPRPGTHLAIVQTANPNSSVYHGVAAIFSVHNPSVLSSQYSSGVMIIQNGDDRIQVGWTVNPGLNNDNRTRLFQYLDAGNSHCFNTLCPGFVSVRADIPIDAILSDVSVYGKPAAIINFFVYQDSKNGNWWLQLDGEVNIGFWPQQIFNGLQKSASFIAVGGETYSPPGQPLPNMGNGHFTLSFGDLTTIAYCNNFLVVDENFKQIEPQNMEELTDSTNYYGVKDEGHIPGVNRLVIYGGGNATDGGGS